jgi:hypothetical protein
MQIHRSRILTVFEELRWMWNVYCTHRFFKKATTLYPAGFDLTTHSYLQSPRWQAETIPLDHAVRACMYVHTYVPTNILPQCMEQYPTQIHPPTTKVKNRKFITFERRYANLHCRFFGLISQSQTFMYLHNLNSEICYIIVIINLPGI